MRIFYAACYTSMEVKKAMETKDEFNEWVLSLNPSSEFFFDFHVLCLRLCLVEMDTKRFFPFVSSELFFSSYLKFTFQFFCKILNFDL